MNIKLSEGQLIYFGLCHNYKNNRVWKNNIKFAKIILTNKGIINP